MENLTDMWVEEDLYELIDDYLIAIGRGNDDEFKAMVRNFEEYWDFEACNKMITYMINTVYEINDN